MNDGLPLRAMEWMQPPELLADFPSLLDGWQWIVGALAFLLLAGGHCFRLYEARNESKAIMHEWYMTVVVLIFAVLSPVITHQLAELGKNRLPGPDPTDVARKLITLAFAFPDLESLMERRPAEEGSDSIDPLRDEGLWGYGNAFWEELETDILVEDSGGRTTEVAAAVTQEAAGLKAWAVMITYAVSTSALIVAAAAAWLMDMVRQGGFLVLAFVLPAIIACFRVRSLKFVAHRGVLALASLAIWPIGWALVHLVTAKLFDGYVAVYVAGESGHDLSWNDIDASGRAPVWAGYIEEVGMAVPYTWMLMVNLASLGLLAWTICSVVGVPWLISRTFRWVPSPMVVPARQRNSLAGTAQT